MNDREWDKRLRIRTTGREDESDPECSPYEPTPYAVLGRLADSGHIKRRTRLMDYGCGKGRVAFFMAREMGCRVTGIDRSPRLIDIARENGRASRLGDRVALICCPAEQHALGDEDAFFFFNPFSERVFASVLRRIHRAWQEAPRGMEVICYYPSEEYIRCLEEAPDFVQVDEIDCGDLFNGKNPRERIVVFALPSPKE